MPTPTDLVRQGTAAQMCRVSYPTVRNWERAGLLKRANTPRLGAWYERAQVDALAVGESGVEQLA